MKFNGEKVKVFKDKKGPYDAYLYKGSLLPEISDKYTVSKAFDYQGDHYGIVRRYHNAKLKFLILLIIAILVFLGGVIHTYSVSNVYCVISKPDRYVLTSDNQVELKITNNSPDILYIYVNGVEHMLKKDETLFRVPYVSTPFTITYVYNGHSYEEEVLSVD